MSEWWYDAKGWLKYVWGEAWPYITFVVCVTVLVFVIAFAANDISKNDCERLGRRIDQKIMFVDGSCQIEICPDRFVNRSDLIYRLTEAKSCP